MEEEKVGNKAMDGGTPGGGTLLWIGGWASGLACWRGELEARYPGREHRFLDAHDALADAKALESAVAGLPAGGMVLGWSLGSLLLHRALASGMLPARRAVSLCPIFDFCGAGSPWPPAALNRMIRRLSTDREGVLSDFWSLVRGRSPLSREAEECWRAQAGAYSPEVLIAGLESLGRLKADPADLQTHAGRLAFVASPGDPLTRAGFDRSGRGGWVLYPGGHLPFLDYPEVIRPLLEPTP